MTRRKATRIIQRFMREILRRPTDPLTFERVYPPFFLCQHTLFSAYELINYILETGATRHPITQEDISQEDLEVLALITNHPPLTQESLSHVQQEIEQRRQQQSLETFYLEEALKISQLILQNCSKTHASSYPSRIITNAYIYVPHLAKFLMETFAVICNTQFIALVHRRLREKIEIIHSEQEAHYHMEMVSKFSVEVERMFGCFKMMSQGQPTTGVMMEIVHV